MKNVETNVEIKRYLLFMRLNTGRPKLRLKLHFNVIVLGCVTNSFYRVMRDESLAVI